MAINVTDTSTYFRQIENRHKKYNMRRSRHYERDEEMSDRVKAGVGALLGTAIPMAVMMKKRGIKNPLKLKYNLQDMVVLSASSIAGGVGVATIGESKAENKNRLKEGVFQFLNAAVPTWLVGGALKLCETSKHYNNTLSKVGAIAGALIFGMYGAAEVSNRIFDPYDLRPDRNLKLVDCIANADDAIGALVLAKFPLIEKLHLEKALPAIYALCGYRSGKSN
ncbi:hypothetical protein J6I39_04420 [bacterium]|nr:hypothetical protein [bacterium]